jgi:hypothetical protein
MTANEALQEWIKTQALPVSSIEEHGFINGYEWATAKTLTDEEIIREWVDATYLDASQCTDDIKEFARAILRKAQEHE